MIANILRRFKHHSPDFVSSRLHNEQTFYKAFIRDLSSCKDEAIIECPFMTSRVKRI